MPVGNKSQRSRVQGGWAKPSSAVSKPSSKQREEKASENIHKLPVWVGKRSEVDDPPNISIRFQQPAEKDLKLDDTHTRLITEPGVYDLSAEPSGVSRIKLFHNFVDEKSAARMFTELSNEVPWEQKSDVKDGVRYLQPRVVAWYGDQGYSYSGLSHSPRPQLLSPLLEVKHLLEENTGLQFNSVLCNLYRDNKDHVSWHSDDEELFGRLPTIASVSLGDTRMFELRRKVKPNSEGEFVYKEFVKVPLPAGSLLLMEGATQLDWQHRIPTEYHDRGPRINLTYRNIVT